MTVNILRTVGKIALPLALAALALPAYGVEVVYKTVGVFADSAGCVETAANLCGTISNGGATDTFGTVGADNLVSVTFIPVTDGPGTVNADPFTDAQTGTFVVSSIKGTDSNLTALQGNFTLTISQTVPSVNSGSLQGSLTGSIDFNNSLSGIVFAPAQQSLTLGQVVYTLDVQTTTAHGACPIVACYTLPTPGSGGTKDVTMLVDASNVTTPEPTFMMLTGLGFAGLAFVAYRRKRTV